MRLRKHYFTFKNSVLFSFHEHKYFSLIMLKRGNRIIHHNTEHEL
jgi:hypothetical protein